jgi:hypothetical protein
MRFIIMVANSLEMDMYMSIWYLLVITIYEPRWMRAILASQ